MTVGIWGICFRNYISDILEWVTKEPKAETAALGRLGVSQAVGWWIGGQGVQLPFVARSPLLPVSCEENSLSVSLSAFLTLYFPRKAE